MNATIMKGERSKLLAVVLALAMVVVGAAVVLGDSIYAGSETVSETPASDVVDGSVTVYDAQQFRDVIAGIGTSGNPYEAVSTIVIGEDFTVDHVITVNKNVTIDGGDGKILTAIKSSTFTGGWVSGAGATNKVISIEDANVTIKNITIDSNDFAYGVNIYCTTDGANDVIVDNVTSNNSVGAGFIINGVDATLNNVKASGNVWGSINLDKGASLTLTGTDNVLADGFQVYSEEDAEVTTTGSNYDFADADRFGWGKGNTDGFAMILDGKLNADVTLSAEDCLVVSEGQTLTVPEGVTLTNNGIITGQINGEVENNGVIMDSAGEDSSASVSTYDGLVLAAESGSITNITLAEGFELEGDVTLAGKTLDLNGQTIVSGVYTITLDGSTLENGTVQLPMYLASAGDAAVVMKKASAISDVVFDFVAGTGSYLNIATLLATGSTVEGAALDAKITNVTYDTDGVDLWDDTFFAVAVDAMYDGEKVAISGGDLNSGTVQFKGGNMAIADAGEFVLNIVNSVTIDGDNLKISGNSSIIATSIGWLGQPAGTATAGSVALIVTGDYELGNIYSGKGNAGGTQGVRVDEDTTLTAYGGDGLDQFNVKGTGSTYAVTDGQTMTIAGTSAVEGTIEIPGESTLVISGTMNNTSGRILNNGTLYVNGTLNLADVGQISGNGIIYSSDPANKIVVEETSDVVTSDDFYIVLLKETVYNGKDQYPEYRIVGPSNYRTAVFESGRTAQINVGPYNFNVKFSITQVDEHGNNIGQSTEGALTVNWEILPAESKLVFGEYNKDTIYGADVDDIIDSTVDFIVTQTGTDVTFTGNLLYYDGTWADGTWPAEEQKGYYILFSVDWMDGIKFDKDKVVLSYGDKTYNATTFDNCMLFYLGENPTITAGMKINIDYDGEGKNFSDTTYDIDFSGVSLKSHIDIGIYGDDESENDNVYDVPVEYLTSIEEITQSGETASVTANVYYYNGEWAGADWPANMDEGYYLVISVTNPTGSWTDAVVKVNGEELSTKPFDGYLVKFLGTTEADFPESITFSADIDGDGDRYTEGQKVITLDLTTSVNIIVDVIDSDDNCDLGTIDGEAVEIGDLQGEDTAVESKETADNTYTLYFTGTLNWMHGYTWYNSADADEQRGYYIGFTVDLPQGWDGATVTTYMPDGTTAKKTFDGNFDGYFVWKVDSDAQADKFTVDIDGTIYTYILDFSGLDFVAAGGYYDNDQPAGDGVEENLLGFVKDDVVGETMYMAFSNKNAGIVEFELTFNGEPVYTETTSDVMSAGPHIWYFSFIDQVLKNNGDDYVPAPGLYTMTATIGEEQIAEATAYYPGPKATGYGEDAADAIAGMEENGYEPVNTPTDHVVDKTAWVVWYGADYHYAGSVNAVLSLDGKTIFEETSTGGWLDAGLHGWYFSFLDGQPLEAWYEAKYGGNYVFTYGIYDVEFYAGDDLIFTTTIDIQDPNTYNVFLDEGWDKFDPSAVDPDETYDVNISMDAGQALYLPNTGYTDRNLLCWALYDENGQFVRNYNAGSLVIIGQIPGNDGQDFVGQTYHFVAVYENSAEVDEPSVYIDMPGTFVTGQEYIFSVTTFGTYTTGNVMAWFNTDAENYTVWYFDGSDWAILPGNFFGPVNNGFAFTDSEASYFKIVFEETGDYDITVEIRNYAGEVDGVPTMGETVVCSDSTSFTVLPESTSGGDEGNETARQMKDYYFEYNLDENGLTVTIKTDKIDGYRNVLESVVISWSCAYPQDQGRQVAFINEPDSDGVVLEYTFEGVSGALAFMNVHVEGIVSDERPTINPADSESATGTNTESVMKTE